MLLSMGPAAYCWLNQADRLSDWCPSSGCTPMVSLRAVQSWQIHIVVVRTQRWMPPVATFLRCFAQLFMGEKIRSFRSIQIHQMANKNKQNQFRDINKGQLNHKGNQTSRICRRLLEHIIVQCCTLGATMWMRWVATRKAASCCSRDVDVGWCWH